MNGEEMPWRDKPQEILIPALPGFDPRADILARDDVIECCDECGDDIEMQIFKGTGVCTERCAKDRRARLSDPDGRVQA